MRRVPIWLFGVGGVGSTLLAMLSDDEVRSRIESRTGCEFVPVFLADSSGYMLQPEGLPAELLPAVQVIKQARRPLTELRGARQCASPDEAFEALRSAVDLPASIGVDATASDAMGPILVRAVEAGGAVALANKRPLTAGYAQFEALTASRRCRHEATVGAGLPVIATLYSLLDSGDSVSSIVGCFSGTLAYLCSALYHNPDHPAVLGGIIDTLDDWMRRKGYADIAAFRGRQRERALGDGQGFERAHYFKILSSQHE